MSISRRVMAPRFTSCIVAICIACSRRRAAGNHSSRQTLHGGRIPQRNGCSDLCRRHSAEADVVVGCDGIRSAVRASVFGATVHAMPEPMCWRALVPTDALPKDFHNRHVNQWSGDTGSSSAITFDKVSSSNFVCVRPQLGWTEQSWSVPSSAEEMLAAFPRAGENCAGCWRKRRLVRSGDSFLGSTLR